jgi:tetratricopeptide (TPR) repeat protein
MFSHASVQHVLHTVAPAVAVDQAVLATLLQERPAFDRVALLLNSTAVETVRAGVVYLGVHGAARETAVLVMLLQHPDAGVAELAEYGLWNIWMQAGSPAGNRRLATAIEMIQIQQAEPAIRTLASLTDDEPRFAEAFHQLGIAHAMLEHWENASQAYRQALRLIPNHFAAAAGLGNVCLEQFNPIGALYYYRRALQIHPRLPGVADAIAELAAHDPQRGTA